MRIRKYLAARRETARHREMAAAIDKAVEDDACDEDCDRDWVTLPPAGTPTDSATPQWTVDDHGGTHIVHRHPDGTVSRIWRADMDENLFDALAAALNDAERPPTTQPTAEWVELLDAVRDHLEAHGGYAADSDDETLNRLDDAVAALVREQDTP